MHIRVGHKLARMRMGEQKQSTKIWCEFLGECCVLVDTNFMDIALFLMRCLTFTISISRRVRYISAFKAVLKAEWAEYKFNFVCVDGAHC